MFCPCILICDFRASLKSLAENWHKARPAGTLMMFEPKSWVSDEKRLLGRVHRPKAASGRQTKFLDFLVRWCLQATTQFRACQTQLGHGESLPPLMAAGLVRNWIVKARQSKARAVEAQT